MLVFLDLVNGLGRVAIIKFRDNHQETSNKYPNNNQISNNQVPNFLVIKL